MIWKLSKRHIGNLPCRAIQTKVSARRYGAGAKEITLRSFKCWVKRGMSWAIRWSVRIMISSILVVHLAKCNVQRMQMWSHRKYFLFLSLTIDPMTRATLIPADVAESLRWGLLAGIDRIDLSGGSCREDRVCTVLGVFSCLSNRVLFVGSLWTLCLFISVS